MFRVLPLTLLLAVSACHKDAAGDDEPVQVDGVEVPQAPLKRLSTEDYVRTLRVLVGDDPVDAIQPLVDALPRDAAEEEGFFARNDQRAEQLHIDGHYAIADALARATVADPALRVRLGGVCETVEPGCLEPFTRTFLARVLRRPATEAEVQDLLAGVADLDGEDQLHGLVFLGLMKPELVYHFENQGEAEDGLVTLTGYELASRLSYHFWGEPPDAALLAAAEDGSLLTDEGLRAQVDRLFDDPRTELTLRAFFDEWLHLHRGQYVPGPRHDILAEGVDTVGLAAEMREETHALLAHAAFEGQMTWEDVLTTRESFARSERLAGLYGVEPWDGEGARPLLPEGERSGLLTRAGMVASNDGSTNPFRRGAFVRKLMLCEHVDPPPGDLPPDALIPPDPSAATSTRDAFAAKVDNNQCRGCHSTFSPLGYALETYDGFGRYRSEERLVDSEGNDFGTVPVDTVVDTYMGGSNVSLDGAVELSAQLAATADSRRCLARQYFRYAHRRGEADMDQALIESWTDALLEGESLGDFLRRVALHPTFRHRAHQD